MKSPTTILTGIALALIACLVWIFWPAKSPRPFGDSHGNGRESLRIEVPEKNRKSIDAKGIVVEETVDSNSAVARLIDACFDRFLVSSGAEESSVILRELRDGIRSSEPQAAASAVVGFLKSGKDAPTRLPFVIGPEGLMELTPTLRTALLDLLPSLDPTAALDVSRGVMDQQKSPDEYALALRNLAWNDLNGDLKGELSDCLERMIANKEWSNRPSSGFLEALDAGVEILTRRSFDSMVRLNAEGRASSNSPLVRASFIVLDRMVLRDPILLVTSFEADPDLSGFSPDQRASLMSRLDLTEPLQRNVFSKYLSSPSHGPGELEYLANLFPNGNCLVGNWLITTKEVPHSIASRQQADRAVLLEIGKMLAENPNQQVYEALVRIQERLQKFTKE